MYDIPISYAEGGAYSSGVGSGNASSTYVTSIQMIGCTCGGHGPCRATCRTPL